MSKTIRIASGQGFWGDRSAAPVEQVKRGPIDYLMLDHLAEVTRSTLQKQRPRDASQGYAQECARRDYRPQHGHRSDLRADDARVRVVGQRLESPGSRRRRGSYQRMWRAGIWWQLAGRMAGCREHVGRRLSDYRSVGRWQL